MSRLVHSAAAIRRLAEMSQAAFFVCVEGWTDRGFYSQLCDATLGARGLSFQIRTAEEIEGGSGGKQTLLTLFRLLADKGALVDTFQGKKTVFLFFLDKDLDDFAGLMVTSPHLVYTKYYHMENYPFKHGNFARILSSAASLDTQATSSIAQDSEQWCKETALHWKEWVKLCVQATLDGVPCRCRYSSPSQVNRVDGTLDAAALAACEHELLTQSADAAAAQKRRAQISALVEECYAMNAEDSVFRGMWYRERLASRVSGMVASGARHGLKERLAVAAMATLDFRSDWAEHLRTPTLALLG